MLKNKNKMDSFVMLLLFLFIAAGLSLWLRLNLFISSFLFWGLPAVYFTRANKKAVGRAILFTLVAVAIFGLLADYIGTINHVWYTPHTIFPFRLFQLVPLENPLWAFLYVYTVVMAYESFYPQRRLQPVGKRFYVLAGTLIVLSAIVHWAAAVFPRPFADIPYTYAVFGVLCFLLPTVIFLGAFPRYAPRFATVACFLLPTAFVNEIVGLRLAHWYFPGTQYVGRLAVFGVHIPFEELTFFIVTGPLAILSYYIYFCTQTEGKPNKISSRVAFRGKSALK